MIRSKKNFDSFCSGIKKYFSQKRKYLSEYSAKYCLADCRFIQNDFLDINANKFPFTSSKTMFQLEKAKKNGVLKNIIDFPEPLIYRIILEFSVLFSHGRWINIYFFDYTSILLLAQGKDISVASDAFEYEACADCCHEDCWNWEVIRNWRAELQ